MNATAHLVAGRFEEAIAAYKARLTDNPSDGGSVSGLSHAYMGAGLYREAIPWLHRVHEERDIPDSPGEWLNLACAHWCLEDSDRAIVMVRELCEGIQNKSVNMAPDQAGGATFGLILHFMAVETGDREQIDLALAYLRKLNVEYDKHPTWYRYPVATVKQVLGEFRFEKALEGATQQNSLDSAYQAADQSRSIKMKLGVALFHDGVMRSTSGDKQGYVERMRQVFDIGYQTDQTRWLLARHAVVG